MATTYPYGYGTSTCSLDTLQSKYAHQMHPEFARRLFNWIAAQDGAIGIGGGSRPCPDPVSSASKACKSFHQLQQFKSGLHVYSAVDLVAKNGSAVHRAPVTAEVPVQGSADAEKWGVHANVSAPGQSGWEPWHLQCVEQDGFDSWVNAGRPDPAANYPIPGGQTVAPPTNPPDPAWPPFNPESSEYSLYPHDASKAEVHRKCGPQPADLIEYLQGVMTNQCKLSAGPIDGQFGSATEAAVRTMQGWNGLEQDGRCGSKTWKCVDAYALR